MSKKIISIIFILALFLIPKVSFAREKVTDWYIKDFDTQILVNKDSSLDITETITADCGNALDKHGIFRILPTELTISEKKIKTPIALISITDEKGQVYKYQTTKNSTDGTITWKIGDANTTVQGQHTYVIHYIVQNAIRFTNDKYDELYWNLNGNFWDLETDRFHASIVFPSEVTQENATVYYYTGLAGAKKSFLVPFAWSKSNVLDFDSDQTLLAKQGITASIVFPKNIFTQYKPTLYELYGQYLPLIVPLLALIISFLLWLKYGKDPQMNKTIIAQYDIPENLSPVEMGMLLKNGRFDNTFITAELIWFATKGLITIKETQSKILFFTDKDYELTQNHDPSIEKSLNASQQAILAAIFKEGSVVKLSSLKNSFYTNIQAISTSGKESLKIKGLILTKGINMGTVMRVISPVFLWISFAIFSLSSLSGLSMIATTIILFAFSFIMPKRTMAGAELVWKIKGFQLFLETVDKDRAAFYEKENIFEKCLPYAILFGMTKQWIQKMQDMYGQDYYATHAPIWYVGSISSFDANSFSGVISSLSSDIANNTSSPSGSGGSGGSGGGGGGGGGGGW
jgi:uncharacterized membrane protein